MKGNQAPLASLKEQVNIEIELANWGMLAMRMRPVVLALQVAHTEQELVMLEQILTARRKRVGLLRFQENTPC